MRGSPRAGTGFASDGQGLGVGLEGFVLLAHPAVDITQAVEGVGLARGPFQLSRNRHPLLKAGQRLRRPARS